MRRILPYWRVKVSGPSMVPTLRHDDVVLVCGAMAVAPGHVVVARYRSMPDRLVIKRAARIEDGGWWLTSDNAFAGGDSESHGVADVEARVLVKIAPLPVTWMSRSGPMPPERSGEHVGPG